MADVITNTRVVIAEAVVIEASLIVLILSQLAERDEVTNAFYVSKVTINIIISLPNYVTIAVVRFHRATHIVADNRVAFTVLYLCHRNVRAFLIHPCDKVFYWFFALHTDATELVNAMLRSVLLLILPLLHHHVAIPEIAEDVTIKEFCRTTPKGIIFEADCLAVRKPHLFEHSVIIPFIGIVTSLPSNMRATFLRYFMVRMLCQSATWSLQYEVALYVIKIVIIPVTENPAALAVFPVATVTTAEDVDHSIGGSSIIEAYTSSSSPSSKLSIKLLNPLVKYLTASSVKGPKSISSKTILLVSRSIEK